MSLPEFSIKKRVTTVMVTLGLAMGGIICFLQLPQELFPPIVFPQVTVITDYANAAPEEIETLITKPIEEAVGSVSGLKRVVSVSREGRSTVNIFFHWGKNINFAHLAVREKIDLIKERLPKESEDPVVLKFDPLAKPIMILSISAPELEPVKMKYLTEKIIKDNLEKLEGVASVTISGGLDREVLVDIDQGRLHANHISLLDVIESIENANVTYPAGSIKKGLYEYLIRTVGEFRSVKEVGYTVIGVDNVEEIQREDNSFLERGGGSSRETMEQVRGEDREQTVEKRLILVRDIASVIDGTSEVTSISRFDGHENISVSIQKQASANTIETVDLLRKTLKFLSDDISARGLHYDVIYDHSVFIRQSLENLFNEALVGGLLAFFVLLFFFRQAVPSLLVSLSIPVAVIGAFVPLKVFGFTLNMMSLGGLALGVGMIVDTSIVVLENIFRRRQLGENAEEGAIRGANEVVWPVISSNLTTIAVFFPLIVFVPGIPGQLFKDLSWSVIFVLVLAILVPITLVTMLSTNVNVRAGGYKPIAWTDFFYQRSIARGGKAFLTVVLIISFGVCTAASFLIFPFLEREVLPKVDQGQFLIRVDLPIGTRLEVTDESCQKIEAALRSIDDVKSVSVTIGSEKSEKGEVKIETLRPSQALVLVALDEDRKRTSADVVADFEKELEQYDMQQAEIKPILQESEFAFAEGGVNPIVIEVKGYDFEKMGDMVHTIESRLAGVPGVINIQNDQGESYPETKIQIDKRKAALYGISALDVSLIAKAAIDGVVATQYREAGKEYDIKVRLRETDRDNLEKLGSLLLYSQVLDELVQLKEVASIESGTGPAEIRRVDQERTITVAADIDKRHKKKTVNAQLGPMIQSLNITQESGIQVQISGQAAEVQANFAKVTFAGVLAIILVYMIMASLFESFIQPLIIMITVPLSFLGVALGLAITGTSVNVISLLGVVMLFGIVVNNGIVLIEYSNQLRDEGMSLEEAAWEASKVRTRPILMSALTTIFALIPLALGLGEGAELRSPLAVTVMSGLISSTFLTLIVIPALYILMTRVSDRLLGREELYEEEETAG